MGARDVVHEDDLGGVIGGRLEFVLGGRHGAQEQIADVGEDRRAARGDAALGEKKEEFGEEGIDVGGGSELDQSAGEVGGEVGDIAFLLQKLGVTEAEEGAGVEGAVAATPPGGGALAAAR